MANIIRNVDKIITSSNTEVDLENIQASSGGASGLEGSGIAYSTDGTDEFYDAGASSEVIALDINNPQDGDGLIYDAASQTWKNGEIALAQQHLEVWRLLLVVTDTIRFSLVTLMD